MKILFGLVVVGEKDLYTEGVELGVQLNNLYKIPIKKCSKSYVLKLSRKIRNPTFESLLGKHTQKILS